DGDRVAYDNLVLAAGAITATFGVPGVERHAFPLKSVTDAVRLRAHLLEQFERAEAHPDTTPASALTTVVVGGGPTGVELCGGLSELYRVLAKDHPRLDMSGARIVLLEATERVLGAFHPGSSENARDQLSRRGVEVRLSTTVAAVEADRVCLAGGEDIPCETLIWTAGVRPSPLGRRLGLPTTRDGRVVVGPDLSVEGHPEVFVIGDLAAAEDRHGRLYPQLAPVAMQEARHAVRTIRRRADGRPVRPFHYRDKGTMATIGRNAAVAELPGGIRFRGFLAWAAWLGLHLLFLMGFRNRLTVLLDWSWNYLTYERGPRLILPVVSDDPAEE
ncbi:MAG TPA: FAD-dependent oxidoreductase, partial [Acidimicrobiales bacterium]|nr:FAD-dependent oxidoreductase [Acidimicrobiales bacterium]